MKKIFLIQCILLCTVSIRAQKIGINKLNPLSTLHVNSEDSAVLLLANVQDYNEGTKASMYFAIGPFYTGAIKSHAHTSAGARMGFFTGASPNGNSLIERLSIMSTGNVGIGTTSPSAPLTFPATIGKKITLYPGASGDVGFGVVGNLLQIYSDYAGADIGFGYGSSSSFTENMRIRGNGNVGIGTSNPLASLQVARGDGVNGTAMFAGTTYSSHFNYSTTEDTYIRGGKLTSKVLINDIGVGNVSIAAGGGNVSLVTGGGFVGIGVAAPTVALDLLGDLRVADGTQGSNKVMTSDATGKASWQENKGVALGFYANRPGASSTFITSNTNYEIQFGSVIANDGGYYNGVSRFSVPKTGMYQFSSDLLINHSIAQPNTSTYTVDLIQSDGINICSNTHHIPAGWTGFFYIHVSSLARVTAGTLVKINLRATLIGTQEVTNGHFYGSLIYAN